MAATYESKTPDRAAKPEPFEIAGETYHIYRPKKFALLELARAADESDTMASATIVFRVLDTIFDDESRTRIAARMRDPRDPFDLDDLTDELPRMLEHWRYGDDTAAPNRETRRAAGKATRKTATRKTTAKRA